MGNEVPRPPEMPLELPKPTPKKRRTKLYIGIALVIILVLAIVSTYLIADSVVTDALNSVQVEQGNVEIKNISLFPPSMDATVNIILRNPSEIDININSFKADMLISSGGKNYAIGSLNVENKPLPSEGMSVIPFDIHVSSDVAEVMASGSYTMVLSGKLSVSGQYLFWTITKEKTATSTSTV